MRIVLALIGILLSVPASAQGDLFADLHARGREAEAKMQTIRARFTQTTVSALLAKPMVAKGTLIAAKPPRLVMTYTSPERKTVVMNGNALTVVWHDRGDVERIDITEVMKRVNHYFTNASVKDVRRIFDVRAFPDADVANTYQIEMIPKRKPVKQGLERLQIWVSQDTLLMKQMKMSFPGGDSNTIRIDESEINVPVDPKAFEVPAPQKR